jgi:hypothetical protein
MVYENRLIINLTICHPQQQKRSKISERANQQVGFYAVRERINSNL